MTIKSYKSVQWSDLKQCSVNILSSIVYKITWPLYVRICVPLYDMSDMIRGSNVKLQVIEKKELTV